MRMQKVNLLILPPLLLITLAVFYFLSQHADLSGHRLHRIFYGILLVFCNIGVLVYHWFVDPHPKFYINKTRRRVLSVHLVAGTLELATAGLAFVLHSPVLAIIAALTALFFHLPSSIYLTPDVFGAKGVMVPSYTFVILLNAFFAVRVLFDPSSHEWIINLFLTLNIYVLCRIFYILFEHTGMFPNSKYTASILVAGFMIVPAVLGPLGNVVVFLFLMIDLFLFQKIMGYSRREIDDLYIEHGRTGLDTGIIRPILDKNFTYQIINQHPDYSLDKPYTERELARLFFDLADEDKSGDLNFSEWQYVSRMWKIRSDMENEFFKKVATHHRIDFDTFYENVWLMGSGLTRVSDETFKKMPLRDQAFFIFKQLDLYNQQKIGEFELELLLAEWGLRPKEIKEYLREHPSGVSFDEFYKFFSRIWKYYSHDHG